MGDTTKVLTQPGLELYNSEEKKWVTKKIDEKVNSKMDIDQGAENSGKILVIDDSGKTTLGNMPEIMDVVYHEEEKILEFVSKPQLSGNVSVDSSLSTEGNAADSKAVGDAIQRLSDEIDARIEAYINEALGGEY